MIKTGIETKEAHEENAQLHSEHQRAHIRETIDKAMQLINHLELILIKDPDTTTTLILKNQPTLWSNLYELRAAYGEKKTKRA